MPNTLAPVSPFSLGPGGSRFELLVAEYYMSAMLKNELPLGYERGGLIFSVALQQRNKDNPVDDVVIKAENGSLSIQVKHKIQFTSNKPKSKGKSPEFYDALCQCWNLYNNPNFQKETDYFGIAFSTSSFSKTSKIDIENTIDWAKTEISVKSYLKQLKKFKGKSRYFTIFQDLLEDISKDLINEETVWQFLRHLILLPFDFDQGSSHSYNELLNKLKDVSKKHTADNAKILQATLYELASKYAIAGGELDTYSLGKQLPQEIYVPINSQQISYNLQKNLAFQIEQKILREKNSKKYIPGVFVEIPNLKDELRYFSDPVLFFQKIVEDLKKIDTFLYNETAAKLNFPPVNIILPEDYPFPRNLQDTITASGTLKKYVSTLIEEFKGIDPYQGDKFSQYLNASNTGLSDEIKHSLWGYHHRIQWDLEIIDKHLDLLNAQIIIVKGKAASGKTNFICNFADTTLRSRHQLTLYITGYDLSSESQITSLKKSIINQFSEDYNEKLSPLLTDIDRISSKEKKPLIIIIDGINEHADLNSFSTQLEQLIADFTSKFFIKFILTCRSEYFDKRFGNLKTASFANKIFFIENLTEKIAPIHKKFMIKAYFRHFKISCLLSNNVVDTFVTSPLILRLFCDAYGAGEKNDSVTLPPLNNIILDVLFKEYNKRISDNFEKQHPDSNFKSKYRKLLNELAGYMLKHKTYSNVPIDSISDELHEIINILVNEGVILRKDLTESSVIENSEVINFTYDEFRDFILAEYLLNKIALQNFEQFKKIFSRLVSPKSPIAEGIGNYSFLIGRRKSDKKILTYLKTLSNYNEIFLKNIFSIDDASISHDDLEEIKRLFHKNSHSAEQIYFRVINRRNRENFPNLNIWVFLDAVAQLNEAEYTRLISPIFSLHFDRMDDTCTSIKKIIDEYGTDPVNLDEDSSLLEILICISPIPTIPSRYFQKMGAFECFTEIAEKHPKLMISLLKKYLSNPDSFVTQKLWHEISFSSLGFFSSKDIFDLASELRNKPRIESRPELCRSLDHVLSTNPRKKNYLGD